MKKTLFSFLAAVIGGALTAGVHAVVPVAPVLLPLVMGAATGVAHYVGHLLGVDVVVAE